ncbi:hypothetical protein [Nocardia sp. NBC_01388]|uniref:hypothetical protein n=1 Tax=Nocardia sp. NBC_01388 TaxID=2903596 RepID=UPI0032469E0E
MDAALGAAAERIAAVVVEQHAATSALAEIVLSVFFPDQRRSLSMWYEFVRLEARSKRSEQDVPAEWPDVAFWVGTDCGAG